MESPLKKKGKNGKNMVKTKEAKNGGRRSSEICFCRWIAFFFSLIKLSSGRAFLIIYASVFSYLFIS